MGATGKRVNWGVAFGVGVAILLGSGTASAVPLALSFSGTITRAPSDWGVARGDAFSGSYLFEAPSSDLQARGDWGMYRFEGPVSGMEVFLNDALFASAAGSWKDVIHVRNDRPVAGGRADWVLYQSVGRLAGAALGPGQVAVLRVQFLDQFTVGQGALTNDLLLTDLDLGTFDRGVFQFAIRDLRTGSLTPQFSGRITDASVTPVPEPGTVFLLGIGLIGLAALARRRPPTSG